jgi:hypothetical protein
MEARAGVLGTAQDESGGRAQPLDPTPSTMGREFDRHHLPTWRPEPPFLPGRIAEPARPRAPAGVYPSCNSPKRKPGKKTAPGACPETGARAEVEYTRPPSLSTPPATANASGRPRLWVRAARWCELAPGVAGPVAGGRERQQAEGE